MWLTGDSEVVRTEDSAGNNMKGWLADTLKSAVATGTAVVLAAGIARIQDYVINIGVPAQTRIGNAPPQSAQAALQGSGQYGNTTHRESLLRPY